MHCVAKNEKQGYEVGAYCTEFLRLKITTFADFLPPAIIKVKSTTPPIALKKNTASSSSPHRAKHMDLKNDIEHRRLNPPQGLHVLSNIEIFRPPILFICRKLRRLYKTWMRLRRCLSLPKLGLLRLYVYWHCLIRICLWKLIWILCYRAHLNSIPQTVVNSWQSFKI